MSKRNPQQSESAETVSAVLKLGNALTRNLSPLFGRSGVTTQQWMLLLTLADLEETPTLAGLARHMLVSKQNVTGMVRRLEDLGLVQKASDADDLRSTRVTLTRRGADMVQRVRPQFVQQVNALLARISQSDRQALRRALDRLLESASA